MKKEREREGKGGGMVCIISDRSPGFLHSSVCSSN